MRSTRMLEIGRRVLGATARNLAARDRARRVRELYGAWLRLDATGSLEPPPALPAEAYQLSTDPELLPPVHLMRTEGIDVLETWYRWAEEWSVMLRVYGRMTATSDVLEIGCGLGRIAFPLRYVLDERGTYHGFDVTREKIDFLCREFHSNYPNFHFSYADIRNTYYNPEGSIAPDEYTFPYTDDAFDVVFAASVFTHLLPSYAERYLAETARVLRSDGIAVFSFFLLDNYVPGQPRPLSFADTLFEIEHHVDGFGVGFAVSDVENPELVAGYTLALVGELAARAGLEVAGAPLAGMWSGSAPVWVGAQDVVLLRRPGEGAFDR